MTILKKGGLHFFLHSLHYLIIAHFTVLVYRRYARTRHTERSQRADRTDNYTYQESYHGIILHQYYNAQKYIIILNLPITM